MGNQNLLAEFVAFIRDRKAWWLAPIIIFLLSVGALVVLGQSAVLSPFIYALF